MTKHAGVHYQGFKINGVTHEGRDRRPEYDLIFPDGVVGESILDLGCNIGYYVFEAWANGASKCLGVDRAEVYHETCLKLKHQFGDPDTLEFVLSNAYNWCPDHPYDTVLCLNVLHHCVTIKRATALLQRLDAWALKRIVLVLTPLGESPPAIEGDGQTWGIEKCSKGVPHVRIMPEYIQNLWPDYTVTSQPSAVNEGRIIVSVIK